VSCGRKSPERTGKGQGTLIGVKRSLLIDRDEERCTRHARPLAAEPLPPPLDEIDLHAFVKILDVATAGILLLLPPAGLLQRAPERQDVLDAINERFVALDRLTGPARDTAYHDLELSPLRMHWHSHWKSTVSTLYGPVCNETTERHDHNVVLIRLRRRTYVLYSLRRFSESTVPTTKRI